MITTTTPIFSAVKRERHAKGITKLGIGIGLLLIGIALIIYGFNAPMANSTSVPQVVNGLPDLKTFALLMGGAAVVVIGVELTFRNKSSQANV